MGCSTVPRLRALQLVTHARPPARQKQASTAVSTTLVRLRAKVGELDRLVVLERLDREGRGHAPRVLPLRQRVDLDVRPVAVWCGRARRLQFIQRLRHRLYAGLVVFISLWQLVLVKVASCGVVPFGLLAITPRNDGGRMQPHAQAPRPRVPAPTRRCPLRTRTASRSSVYSAATFFHLCLDGRTNARAKTRGERE